jgi:hypothetical protein
VQESLRGLSIWKLAVTVILTDKELVNDFNVIHKDLSDVTE